MRRTFSYGYTSRSMGRQRKSLRKIHGPFIDPIALLLLLLLLFYTIFDNAKLSESMNFHVYMRHQVSLYNVIIIKCLYNTPTVAGYYILSVQQNNNIKRILYAGQTKSEIGIFFFSFFIIIHYNSDKTMHIVHVEYCHVRYLLIFRAIDEFF